MMITACENMIFEMGVEEEMIAYDVFGWEFFSRQLSGFPLHIVHSLCWFKPPQEPCNGLFLKIIPIDMPKKARDKMIRTKRNSIIKIT